MAAKKWNIARLYAVHETVFLTDPDATGAAYKHIKTLPDMVFTPEVEVIERPGHTGDLVRQEHVLGSKGGKLSFKIEMKASGTPAATVAIASESSPFLEAHLGSVVRGTGTTIATAGGDGNPTAIKVTSAAGLSKYMMIEVENQTRFITAISGVDITLDRALSAIPATSAVVYASSLFKRANTAHKSMALVAFRDDVEYTFLGCSVTACKLAGVNARGTALLEIEVMVGTFTRTTKASLPAANLTGVTAVKAPVVRGSPLAIEGVAELVSEMSFDPTMTIVFQESTAGADNKSGIEAVNAEPKGAIKPYYTVAHWTDFEAGTVRSVAFSAGDRTNGFGIYVPKAQYLQPALEDRNGMVGENIPFACVDNGTDAEYVICQF